MPHRQVPVKPWGAFQLGHATEVLGELAGAGTVAICDNWPPMTRAPRMERGVTVPFFVPTIGQMMPCPYHDETVVLAGGLQEEPPGTR